MSHPRHELRWNGWGRRSAGFEFHGREEAAWKVVAGALGGAALPETPAVPLGDARLPESRLTSAQREALGRLTAPDRVKTDRFERALHALGRSYHDLLRLRAGDLSLAPDAVVYPEHHDEVAALLGYCDAERLAVVPFGGGSSVVGGVTGSAGPHAAAVTIDLTRMTKVDTVDRLSRTVRADTGVYGPDLEAQLNEQGYTVGHFPQSFEFSTLGGWVATRAGGHYATLLTHIDDLTQAVRVVTPAGVVETPRVPASGAGPDPNRLFLGSEGGLGVITRAWVRVRPAPRWRFSANVRFGRFEDAVEAARAVAQAGLHPANCRVLDGREALLNGVSAGDESVLLLGFESADHAPDEAIARAVALAVAAGGRCDEGIARRHDDDGHRAAAAQRWREAFLGAPYLQSGLLSVGVMADTFETCVPWSRFAALHADVLSSVQQALLAVCGAGAVTCRLTHVYPDGPAPYYTFLGPFEPARGLAQWAAVKAAASAALARHGATITHHHAVGRTHRPWFDRERPDLFAATLRAARGVLDPAGVMNPGVLVDAVSEP